MSNDSVEELLKTCSISSSPSCLTESLEHLEERVPSLDEKGRETVALHLVQNVVDLSSSEVVQSADRCLEACGPRVVLKSVCVPLLLDMAIDENASDRHLAHLSMQTILRTIKRILLSKNISLLAQLINEYKNLEDTAKGSTKIPIRPLPSFHMSDLVKTVLLLPIQIAAACHAQQLILPKWAVSSRYSSRLVLCSLQVSLCDQSLESFVKMLIQQMLRQGGSQDIAVGLSQCYDSIESDADKATFGRIVHSVMGSISSPKECAKLMRSIIQHLVSTVSPPVEMDWDSVAVNELVPYLLQTCRPILECSGSVRRAWIQSVIINSTSSTSEIMENVLPFAAAHLLDRCRKPTVSDSSDSESDSDADDSHVLESDLSQSCLWHSLQHVASVWCLTTHVQRMDPMAQGRVTQFLLIAMKLMFPRIRSETIVLASSTLVSNLIVGVTIRLDSSLPSVRCDGMRVARELSLYIGEPIEFDELEYEGKFRQSAEAKIESHTKPSLTVVDKRAKSKVRRMRPKMIDPDQEYDSEESTSSDHESVSVTTSDDSIWDDDENYLIPYDLDDDEEDLRAIPRPRYLRECLDLLNSSEENHSAFSAHEAALQEVEKLVRSKPGDVAQFAIPLGAALLYMENKFSIAKFDDLRHGGLVAITIGEPSQMGPYLVDQVFESVTLDTRMEIFHTLEDAAHELCGAKVLELDANARTLLRKNDLSSSGATVSGNRRLVNDEVLVADTAPISRLDNSIISSDSRTRRWGAGRRPASRTSVSNRFGLVAPVWFYSLLNRFVKSKDESSIWGGANGPRLLAQLFVSLSVIVDCCGNYPASSILAKDLFDLVWSFRSVEEPHVRTAALVSMASSLPFLSVDVLMPILVGSGSESLLDFLSRTARDDADRNCRSVAKALSGSVSQVVGAIEGAHSRTDMPYP